MTEDLGRFVIRVAKGKTIFSEGESGSEMYFVQSGKVSIQKSVAGKTQVLSTMEKGDFFGEMSVIDQIPRTATAVAEEDAELLKVDAENFEKLLQGNIEIAVRMIRKYSARLRETNEKLMASVKDRTEVDASISEILHSVKKPVVGAASEKAIAEFVGDAKTGVFRVTGEDATIGRIDPVTNIVPDIDLTAVDPTRSVSRRHARLRRLDGVFMLTEEVGVQNGTVVNGGRLTAGTPFELTNGATVAFGNVSFKFRAHD